MGRRNKGIYEHDTRLRLIDAAGNLFAENGYAQTTIRDICDTAGTNIASVNYHFSSKMELYEATLEYALLKDEPSSRRSYDKKNHASEEDLYLLILDMIKSVRLTTKPAWFPRLLRREILFPTAEFQEFTQRVIKEDFERVYKIVRAIEPQADTAALKTFTLLLLGQVKSIAMESDAVLKVVVPQMNLDIKGCQKIARQITDMAIAGLKTCQGKKPTRRPRSGA